MKSVKLEFYSRACKKNKLGFCVFSDNILLNYKISFYRV